MASKKEKHRSAVSPLRHKSVFTHLLGGTLQQWLRRHDAIYAIYAIYAWEQWRR